MSDVLARRQKKKRKFISSSFSIPESGGQPIGLQRSSFIRSIHIDKTDSGQRKQKRNVKDGGIRIEEPAPSFRDEPQPGIEDFTLFPADGHEGDLDNDEGVDIEVKAQRLKELDAWLCHRSEYLDEFLHLDGRGHSMRLRCCFSARSGGETMYRCRDCLGTRTCCRACVLTEHTSNPLHRIEEWCGYWKKISLETLGLVIQLGHPEDRGCPTPAPEVKPLVIVHTNGIHSLSHRFCGCDGALPKRYQILREKWFPATQSQPATAFTFDVLDFFLELSYQGKINAHDFCASLENLTEGSGLNVPKRYEEFLRVSREYSHILLLKRGGRGHIDNGIITTSQGELAIDCPSCPHPGKNMLDDWEEVGEDESWVYGIDLAMDANFRLKLKDRGVNDPEMGPGWAYFVHDERYKAEIAKHPQPKEPSDCTSTHQAIERATSKSSDGYSVTGIGAVICSRHGFVRPNGVGDLQHGERYANMDYIFLASIMGMAITYLTISYDIACQWSRHLRDRVSTFPSNMTQSFFGAVICYFIPKFHLPAHGEKCQGPYSLNWNKHVGRTDGEGIERGWSLVNMLATMLREMGPGFRHDTFDNHWSALNWRKLTGLGKALRLKLARAVENAVKHSRKHATKCDNLDKGSVSAWTKQIDEWMECPFDKPNPFLEPPATRSLADVRRQLAADEEDLEWSSDGCDPDSTSPSAFIFSGLELEEQIIKYNASEIPKETMILNHSRWLNRRAAIHRKAAAWIELQSIFMPLAAAYAVIQRDLNPSANLDLDNMSLKIWLPSSLRAADRALLLASDAPSAKLLVPSETALRLAQLQDSLDSIKRLLRSKVSTKDFSRRNLRGQKSGTRARTALSRLDRRIKEQADRYRRAYCALLVLDPDGSWKSTFFQLKSSDIRQPLRGRLSDDENDTEDDQDNINFNSRRNARLAKRRRRGEGTLTDSWIWEKKRGPSDDIPKDADDILRVMWARGKARAERWVEEVALILEEMRRTLAYCEWKSSWWMERASLRTGSDQLIEGASAYALKQAEMWKSLASSFADQWAPLIQRHRLPSDWPSSFQHCVPGSGVSCSALNRRWMDRVKESLGIDKLHTLGVAPDALDDVSSSSDSD